MVSTEPIPSFHFPYQSTLAFKPRNSPNSSGDQTAPGSGFLIYQNPSWGIRFQYPSNMSLSEDKRDDGTVYRA